LANRSWELRVHPEGVPVEAATGQSVLYNVVSPEYFATLGVPILLGRGFAASDREGSAPVAIIDETMAAQFWPHADPIGKRITLEERISDRPGAAPLYRTVIGVTKNVRHYRLLQPSRIQAYVPLDQSGQRWGMTLRIMLRTEGPPTTLEAPLRAALVAADKDASLFQVRPLESYVEAATAKNRAMARLLAGFGAGALGLAGLGIFGVMSYLVTRRTREIGIRMALGARAADVIRWIGAGALRLTGLGLILGGLASAFFGRLLKSALFEVSPLDPATYFGVVLVLGGTALLAAWLPARRASRVDPVSVMRQDG
jgi:putative ABC transport system permease protein